MPCPRSIAELIDQTWPNAEEVHDLEIYLDQMWAEWGHQFPPYRNGGHWVSAQSDIQRLAKRPRTRGDGPTAACDRAQLELQLK